MVVGDDPLTWFYYNWGFSGFPIVLLLWWIHRSTSLGYTKNAVHNYSTVSRLAIVQSSGTGHTTQEGNLKMTGIQGKALPF